MRLRGHATDKNGAPVAHALIEVKGDDFVTLYCAQSGEDGSYEMDIPAGTYPFLAAVKDYAVNCLEYWCQNVPLQEELSLDVRFDKLEVYGLHPFFVKGGGNSLMIYFRPMSLPKFLQGARDIAPEEITVRATVDGRELPVIRMNPVVETAGDVEMTAYLVQVESAGIEPSWRRLDIQIWDRDGNFGAASIFNSGIESEANL